MAARVLLMPSQGQRQFFQLYLPQTDAAQSEFVLVCRKKSKSNKFRFSLDPNKMCKRNNPAYVGKMTSYKPNYYLVTLRDAAIVVRVCSCSAFCCGIRLISSSVAGGDSGVP